MDTTVRQTAYCSLTVQILIHLKLEFQGLNYPSQPDRRMLRAISPPVMTTASTEKVIEDETDGAESDEDDE